MLTPSSPFPQASNRTQRFRHRALRLLVGTVLFLIVYLTLDLIAAVFRPELSIWFRNIVPVHIRLTSEHTSPHNLADIIAPRSRLSRLSVHLQAPSDAPVAPGCQPITRHTAPGVTRVPSGILMPGQPATT